MSVLLGLAVFGSFCLQGIQYLVSSSEHRPSVHKKCRKSVLLWSLLQPSEEFAQKKEALVLFICLTAP